MQLVETIKLEKKSGSVDQIIVLMNGNIVVRDFSVDSLEQQKIEIYDHSGRFLRRVGDYGKGPGKYYRLLDMRIIENELWVPDVSGRINIFSFSGDFISSFLLLKPFVPNNICFSKTLQQFFVTGRLAYGDSKNNYYILHKYSVKDKKYLHSYLSCDQEIFEKEIYGLLFTLIDRDVNGKLYLAQAPIHKIYIFDPNNDNCKEFKLNSKKIRSVGSLVNKHTAEKTTELYDNSFLVTSLHVLKSSIWITIKDPINKNSVLEVKDLNGRTLYQDIILEGKLVGKDDAGNIYITERNNESYSILKYKTKIHD
ncbi:MAG: 6-bladed beta-propeller [Candidatus Moranbacteria bacterium]|nr:6-bladed beta-propeller [Candidatus Moranbacteria bacterium]